MLGSSTLFSLWSNLFLGILFTFLLSKLSNSNPSSSSALTKASTFIVLAFWLFIEYLESLFLLYESGSDFKRSMLASNSEGLVSLSIESNIGEKNSTKKSFSGDPFIEASSRYVVSKSGISSISFVPFTFGNISV